MDKVARNALRNMVTKARRLLEDTVAELLQGQFGIHADGRIEGANRMGHLSSVDQAYREQLLMYLEHLQAAGLKLGEAIGRLIREAAFTHLNRLCAYKIMERRGLIRESVSRGLHSNGFMFYLADHPEDNDLWAGGRQDLAYRHFLEHLATTFSREIGALFAPDDPASRLFLPHRVLEQVLDLINQQEQADVWEEDETIGWVYQYFTPKEQREQARAASAAPRSPYELAFRNQFYTPRYVVQFLVDNTLGRIWFAMCHGETRLADKCQYLVKPPEENLAKKDPRDIKVLDPACGSGHFLLYCFDVFQVIYEEAYSDPGLPPSCRTGKHLRDDYPDIETFRHCVPGLILTHNLYGIDIDPRAVQIAALALWFRAQRAYQEMGFGRDNRPEITRINITSAEPMPGEEDLLHEFTATLQPPLLGELAKKVFQKMRQAAELGTLLKIEQDLREDIAVAREQWARGPVPEQLTLFPEWWRPKLQQLQLFDLSGITEASFWEKAENRVIEALERYVARTANGRGYLRQLFAADTRRGLAFIDLCLQRYDVVLMNPPFGEAIKTSKQYIEEHYPYTKNDLYAAFVERGLEMLKPGGMLGAITSRTGFFLSSFQKWREEILLGRARPIIVADLGDGVLDAAMVETAAYMLEAMS